MNNSDQSTKEFILPVTIEEYFRSYRMDELKKYLDVTEKYLKKAKAEFETWSDEQVEGLPTNQRQEFYDFYQDDYWQYDERFPRILRNSFFVSAISLLEYELNLLCSRLKKDYDIRINLSDFRGGTLEQIRKYLQNARLAFPLNNRNWQEINNYYKLRNCIVHVNGLVMELEHKDRINLIPYLKRKGLVSQDTIKQEIALTKSFCEEVIGTIQNFLIELEKKITKV
ncbi:MAG: hypothetical protein A2Z29_11030 [Chloroflexi bacterium RBG_16_56_11]|nr:MAG: hypothetical protein A2Z29_11030 [Chloroflexi bacterium RBG_16_56_11]